MPSSCSKTMLKSLYTEILSYWGNPRQEDAHMSGMALSAPCAIREQNSDQESSDPSQNVISSAVNVTDKYRLLVSGSSEIKVRVQRSGIDTIKYHT